MRIANWIKQVYGVEVGCQCDQIIAGQVQSGHTENQLPPHIRILFDLNTTFDVIYFLDVSSALGPAY